MKNQFVKNVGVLLSGNLLAQLIPIVTGIILTRIYSPDDFAVLAYFFSISGIISVIIGGRYEVAIVLPQSKKEAKSLLALSLLINLVLSSILIIIITFFFRFFNDFFNSYRLGWYLYLIPLSTLLVGIYQSANYYNIRLANFSKMSKVSITRSLYTSVGNISLGYGGLKPGGLILGSLLGQLVGAVMLSKNAFRDLREELPLKTEILHVLHKYKNFPLKNSLSIFFFLLGNQLPILLIGYLFMEDIIIGCYALMLRAFQLPMLTLGKSLSQVYYQETNQNQEIPIRKLFLKTSKYLLLLGIIPSLIVLFFGGYLFKVVFGLEWEYAGVLAQIFIVYYLIRLIFASQNTILISANKLTTEMLFNFIFFITQISSVYIGYKYYSLETVFILMAISGAIQFGVLGLLLNHYSLKKELFNSPTA